MSLEIEKENLCNSNLCPNYTLKYSEEWTLGKSLVSWALLHSCS